MRYLNQACLIHFAEWQNQALGGLSHWIEFVNFINQILNFAFKIIILPKLESQNRAVVKLDGESVDNNWFIFSPIAIIVVGCLISKLDLLRLKFVLISNAQAVMLLTSNSNSNIYMPIDISFGKSWTLSNLRFRLADHSKSCSSFQCPNWCALDLERGLQIIRIFMS